MEPVPADSPFLKQPKLVVTPHLGASTLEAQVLVAKDSAQLLADFLCKGQVRFAVNMTALDRVEMEEVKPFVDLARRLGILFSQMVRGSITRAEIRYRGEVAAKPTRLITGAFAAGLLENWLEQVNLVNARVLEFAGLDPKEWQGFAFGLGIDRIAMLKYGMNDLRAFFDGDARWLSHYGFNPHDVPTLSGGVGTAA